MPMDQRVQLVRMFVLFHVVLGATLLVGSVLTALSGGGHGSAHIRLLGAVEGIGAVMFLFPRTLRPGSWLLLLTIGLALVLHGTMGQWRGDLLVYASGVAFVAVHGSAYGRVFTPRQLNS
jgi:hypothetical protein